MPKYERQNMSEQENQNAKDETNNGNEAISPLAKYMNEKLGTKPYCKPSPEEQKKLDEEKAERDFKLEKHRLEEKDRSDRRLALKKEQAIKNMKRHRTEQV